MKGDTPSPDGTWFAVCYTPKRQELLNVDMQGFTRGSEKSKNTFTAASGECTTNSARKRPPSERKHGNGRGGVLLPGLQLSAHQIPRNSNDKESDGTVTVPLAPSDGSHLPGLQMSTQRISETETEKDAEFSALDTDMDGTIDFIDALLFISRPQMQMHAELPFPFQYQIMLSIVDADKDGDERVDMHRDEFSAWRDSVIALL